MGLDSLTGAEKAKLKKRFREKYRKRRDGCWIWRACTSGGRYGRIKVDGRALYAHRVAYELYREPIPEGCEVDHLCEEPSCVRPKHLRVLDPHTNRREPRMRDSSRSNTSDLEEAWRRGCRRFRTLLAVPTWGAKEQRIAQQLKKQVEEMVCEGVARRVIYSVACRWDDFVEYAESEYADSRIPRQPVFLCLGERARAQSLADWFLSRRVKPRLSELERALIRREFYELDDDSADYEDKMAAARAEVQKKLRRLGREELIRRALRHGTTG